MKRTNKQHDPLDSQVSLKVLLKNKKDEYLVLNISQKDKIASSKKFDLPGGRINKNEVEVPFHTLVDRELKEEIGKKIKYKLRLDPVSIGQSFIPDNIKMKAKETRGRFFVLFEAEYISGSIEISDEHSGFKWLKLKKSDYKKFTPLLHNLIKYYFDWNK